MIEAPPIMPVEREGELPLSFAQQRLWFIQQLEPESGAYNIPTAVRLTGALNLAALRQSLIEIARRHEALRTRFVSREGQPVQVIDELVKTELPLYDLSGLSPEEREQEAREIAAQEAIRPFDLERGPVWRAGVVKIGDQDHLLSHCMHHVASDAWSRGLLVKEFTALYEGYREGRGAKLAELGVQYADFAVWQRQWLQGAVLAEQLSYWRNRLARLPALDLPTDRPRKTVGASRGGNVLIDLSPELTDRLRELSRREGVTLFMTLLAAFQIVLGRYTGQDDIVIGSPIANRNRLETEGLIGFFVNQLVLRTDLSGHPSVRELLSRVRETTLEAYSHQDVPFEKLVEYLSPERDPSRSPLFQIEFALQNIPPEDLRLTGIDFSRFSTYRGFAKFDLTVAFVEAKSGLIGTAEYAAEMYEGSSIERLLGHMRLALEVMVTDPEQRIDEISLLTLDEWNRIALEWNQTGIDYPADECLQEIFEQQVERTPEAVAAVYKDQQLSYAELNRRANQLAHYLRKNGVGTEATVGLLFERGLDMVIALVATLKAGATYVPLDPRYPKERLIYILRDSGARLGLTRRMLFDTLSPECAKLMMIDEAWEEIRRERDDNPALNNTPDAPAYIMYTSGSTGVPKGVCIPHRAISRLVFNTNYVNLGPTDVVAQVSNNSFDAATFEVWGCLLHGGRLALIRGEEALLPLELKGHLEELGITVIFLTTALFNQMAALCPAGFKNVGTVLFGGEAVDPECVRQILAAAPPGRLLHVYGPTESTTFSTWYPVRSVDEGASSIPIGKPLSNTIIYVLDSKLNPAPAGVMGELYIGGDGLACSYHRHPELTAEKFIPDGFESENRGRRIYRTGDIVRYSEDGNIEFIGRRDYQVKIRGFRIEMSEIESALSHHAGVRQCVVRLIEEKSGDKYLAAYVVPSDEWTPSSVELREYLKKKLPEYMAPAAYVLLDKLPLTPNGKIDRHALSQYQAIRPGAGLPHAAPQTAAEQAIASIWMEILSLEIVGIHDNFFDLGGHSLLLIRVHSKLQEEFKTKIGLIELFEYPTIASLAQHLSHSRSEPISFPQSSIRAELRRERTRVRTRR
jgi:amino acid adenylation domain-containing protein